MRNKECGRLAFSYVCPVWVGKGGEKCYSIVMRRLLFALVALLSALAPAQMKDLGAYREPIPPTGNGDLRWLDAALFDSGFLFNEDVRQAYYDHCMRLIAPQLHFSEATWDWLTAHPAVFNAAFSLEYPPNPNVVHNFVKLAKLVGPVYAEKYQQLLIAYAVAYRKGKLLDSSLTADRYGIMTSRNFTWDPKRKAELEQQVLTKQGWSVNHDVAVPDKAAFAHDKDGRLFQDEAERLNRLQGLHAQFDLGSDEDAKQTANWLRQNARTKIYELMGLSAHAFYNKTGIRLSEGREPKGLPWDRIAHVAKRYPPRTEGSVTDNLCLRIMRYEEKGAEKSKLFPLSKAPWPLLLLLTQKDPLDESTYWWNMYKGKGSVPGYATYSFDYTKPEIRYADGDWDPSATPRILTDGGVCGRLSTMAEFAQRSIGTPAQGMGQPGHRAFMTYEFANGKFRTALHHSVDTIQVSTVGWLLPPIYGPVTDRKTKLTGFAPMTGANSDGMMRNNVRWHIGLCEAMNIGLANWENSRMALHILDLYTANQDPALNATREQQEALLRSAMLQNIANTDVVFRLAAARKGNASKILDLMQGFANMFVSVSDGATGATALSRNTDFGGTQAGADLTALMRNQFSTSSSPRNQKKVTNEWALFVRNAIFQGAFTNIPDEADAKYAGSRIEWVRDKNAYAKAVSDELKYQKKLGNSPFLAEVQRLNDKYDKVRLAAATDRTRNVKEERQRRQAEENAW